jgi:Rrf2 family protein
MSTNSRFAVAVHVLTLLARGQEGEPPVTSEYIASSVNTNPVVIRRVLGSLRAAHLVSSQGGNGGGWQLIRAPAAITLRDVYRAMEAEPPFALHHRAPNPNCPVGRHIQQALNGRFAAAARAMEAELARTTIADVLRDVLSTTQASTGEVEAAVS